MQIKMIHFSTRGQIMVLHKSKISRNMNGFLVQIWQFYTPLNWDKFNLSSPLLVTVWGVCQGAKCLSLYSRITALHKHV